MRFRGNIWLTGIGIILMSICSSCYEEIVIDEDPEFDPHTLFSINHIDGVTDQVSNRVFFSVGAGTMDPFIAEIHYENYSRLSFRGNPLQNDTLNDLGSININQPYTCVGTSGNQTDTFSVVFTSLPVVHIVTEEEIVDEPKSLCQIHLQYDDQGDGDAQIYQFKSTAGVEIRGASSMKYSKVSYGVELWKNSSEEDYKTGLLGMRPSEDWILDAMYIDDLRMRNKLSFDIWKIMQHSGSRDEKATYMGINSRFVELLINNEYMGLYCLNEKLSPELLNFEHDQLLRGGVMYKAIYWGEGATKFEVLNDPPQNSFFWDGWEQIYPSHDTCWDPLARLRNFVVNSTDAQFEDSIADMVDLQNLTDYYLFVNLILGYDNTGKNTYLVRTDHASGFRILPWDVEATWGIAWNKERNNPTGILTNHLFERLVATNTEGYTQQLSIQWDQLREELLTDAVISGMVNEYYQLLTESGAYAREKEKWQEFPMDYPSEYQYISKWITDRLAFLDEHFD